MNKSSGSKTQSRLAALKMTVGSPDAVPEEIEEGVSGRRIGVLGRRTNAIGAVANGRQQMVSVLQHPPARIRPWHGHNRDYGALNTSNCDDLIKGFERAQQQIPAIVRRVKDDDGFDFEFIVGARRHWTASYLGRDLLIEVRELDDRQAFILQDLENRDRLDVSDHERAIDYRAALAMHFDGSRQEMARFLKIDSGNFSRLLQLAELPAAIVEAYDDRHELKVHHGTAYHRLIKEAGARKRVLERARGLKGRGLTGKQIFAELKQAASGTRKTTVSKAPRQFGGLELARRVGARRVVVNMDLPKQLTVASAEALQQDFARLLASLESESAPRSTGGAE